MAYIIDVMRISYYYSYKMNIKIILLFLKIHIENKYISYVLSKYMKLLLSISINN